ncbi:MAG: hypothetical protein ACTS5I_06905, partial [Rhodanobacter sp.]
LLEMVQRFFSVNHRMHNKAWIVDGRLAVVGGRNIGDEYFDADSHVNFRDLDMLLLGPAVADASAIFDDFWNSSAAVPIEALSPQTPQNLHKLVAQLTREAVIPEAQTYLQRVAASPSAQRLVNHEMQVHWSNKILVASDPPLKRESQDRSAWLQPRLTAHLANVRHEVLLISPYFVPGKTGTATLVSLALAGTHVGVITNSLAANDASAVHSGYRRYRDSLLDGGVTLHEIRRNGPKLAYGLFGSSGRSTSTHARPTSTPKWACYLTTLRWPATCATNTCAWPHPR